MLTLIARAACVVLLVQGLFVIAAAAAEAPVAVSPEPYFRVADYGLLRLSPSGQYIAGIVPSRGRGSLAVLDIATGKLSSLSTFDGGDIVRFDWVNDNRLVFTVADLQAGLGDDRGGGLFAIDRDGTNFRELAPTVKKLIDGNSFVYRYARMLSPLLDGSDDILVISNDVNAQYPDVYRMNTATGRKTLKSLDKPGDVIGWVADTKGAVRAAVTSDKGTVTHVWWRPSEDAKWVEIGTYGTTGGRMTPVAFDGDGTLIVAADIGRDTTALYRYDTANRKLGELLAAHPNADIEGGVRFDRTKNRIVGVGYDAERPGTAWFDDDWARLQATVDASLPDHVNVLTRGEAPRVLVYSYSDRDPGSYYLLDLTRRKLELVAATRKAIKPEAMPAREAVRYPARDGLEIPAYVTLPKGIPPKNLPLVVLVHGGPWVRGGHWGWESEAAYLAALGYAVLEPDFRSSRGWGRKLFEAGFKQWGRAMQDDLNDGMDWLAKRGTVDPARACIMGASYGGYAVMMGLARDPERWKCGVNYVGVTDINLFFDVAWADYAYSDFIQYTAKEMIGDPDKDAAMLKAASPLANAAKIRAPVLMAYGAQDYRVPLVHGEKMRDALKAQGTPVEWVVYTEEGHGFQLEANRYDFYRRVAAFLAQYLPAR